MKKLKGLAKETEKLLLNLSELELLKDYTFVGGSALALHLEHRLSEDIDLFTWHKNIDKEKIFASLREAAIPFTIISDSKIQMNIVASEVNITFFAQGWEILKDRQHITGHLYLAPLETLAGMKINTLFLRAKYRDYYDLYVLNREVFSFSELFEIGHKLMPELSMKLFQTSLVYTKDIEEDNIHHLSPKYNASIKEIALYFQKEIEKWIKKTNKGG
jgi:predicted nucleotidyltransferase component of viral defense system